MTGSHCVDQRIPYAALHLCRHKNKCAPASSRLVNRRREYAKDVSGKASPPIPMMKRGSWVLDFEAQMGRLERGKESEMSLLDWE